MRNRKISLLSLIWAMSLLFSTGFHSVQMENLPVSAAGDDDDLRLMSSNAQAVSFHLAVPWEEVSQESISVEGESFTKLEIPGWDQLNEPGAPALPYKVVMIGVPFGADLVIDVKVGKSRTIDLGAPVVPAQSQVLADGWTSEVEALTFPEVKTQTRMDLDIYGEDTAYPGVLAKTNNDGIMRGQRIAAIAVYPVQYNPTENSLVIYDEMWVEVRFTHSQPENSTLTAGDHSPFSDLLSATLLNY